MSSSERRRRSKRGRVLCAACQERKAKFKYRQEVRADRDHTLCFECYRSEVNRTRARRLVEAGARWAMTFSFRTSERQATDRSTAHSIEQTRIQVLDDRRLAHRQRMLDHLQRTGSS